MKQNRQNLNLKFTERSNDFISSVASVVQHTLSKKPHTIFTCSTVRFYAGPPEIRHKLSGGCPPRAFYFSIGAIYPHAFFRSNSLGLNEGLDSSQFLGRCHQSQTTAFFEAVFLGNRLGHRTREEAIARVVDKAPVNPACLL